jgi:hypothetical protein
VCGGPGHSSFCSTQTFEFGVSVFPVLSSRLQTALLTRNVFFCSKYSELKSHCLSKLLDTYLEFGNTQNTMDDTGVTSFQVEARTRAPPGVGSPLIQTATLIVPRWLRAEAVHCAESSSRGGDSRCDRCQADGTISNGDMRPLSSESGRPYLIKGRLVPGLHSESLVGDQDALVERYRTMTRNP